MVGKNRLARFQLFAGLSHERLTKIQRLAEEVGFSSGQLIFEEGRQAKHSYGILEGSVALSIVFRDRVVNCDVIHEESIVRLVEEFEKSIVVDIAGPNELLGWSGLVGPHVWTATATAVEDSRLFRLPAAEFLALMDLDPALGYPVAMNLSHIIAKRLAHRTDKLIEVWTEYFDLNEI